MVLCIEHLSSLYQFTFINEFFLKFVFFFNFYSIDSYKTINPIQEDITYIINDIILKVI
jgi:hypothetical protein